MIALEKLPPSAGAQASSTGVQVHAAAVAPGARQRGRDEARRGLPGHVGGKGGAGISASGIDGLPAHLAGLTARASAAVSAEAGAEADTSPTSNPTPIPAFRDAMSAFTSPSVSLMPSRTPSAPSSPASPAVSLIPLNRGEGDVWAGGDRAGHVASAASPASAGGALGLVHAADGSGDASLLRQRVGKSKADWEGLTGGSNTQAVPPRITIEGHASSTSALVPGSDTSSAAQQRYTDAQKRYRAASVGVDGALGLADDDASSSSSEEGQQGGPGLGMRRDLGEDMERRGGFARGEATASSVALGPPIK